MTINYPGPYTIKLFYTISGRDHAQELNLDLDGTPNPGDDFSTIDVVTRDLQAVTLDTYVDTWVGLLQPFISQTSTNFDRAELWSYAAQSFDGTFISAYDVGLPGTFVGTTVIAGELIWTFRTVEGGIMRITIEEPVSTPGESQSYSEMGGTSQDLVDFVLGSGNAWLGRDTSQPISALKLHPGQNERAWKKFYRE